MKSRIKNKKGFTLIELLAVIVILGLLMAIAIPSVTKYITQSRKKTLVSTMDSYVTAVVQEVNDGSYHFSDSTKIFAIPIECISLEKGGTNPFGEWMQANDAYWAYVLVQYDSENYNYKYGFTFKDSAGYGMYPTVSANIDEKSNQVKTGYDSLTKPKSGKAVEFVPSEKWNGFMINDDIDLIVLDSASEGEAGNGETTCTLCQKGDNYDEVEQEKANRPQLITKLIKTHNTLITVAPTLNKSSYKAGDVNGLYISYDTNSGNPTYYFRGTNSLSNNFVSFAGQTWRIVRINEDETIRLILNYNITDNSGSSHLKYSTSTSYSGSYYSNSDIAKPTVDNWYKTNITDKGYDSYVAEGIFCEQAKVSYNSTSIGNTIVTPYNKYTANFKCSKDGNGRGILYLKAGLITYDELVHSGMYLDGSYSDKSYLCISSQSTWTMSQVGSGNVWRIHYGYTISTGSNDTTQTLRPVINLNSNVKATGTGTSSDPYVVQTN